MRELGTYLGTLYAMLNLASLIAIFLFDYYDGKFGGRWGNAALSAMFLVPVVFASALGYALSAYIRDRGRTVAIPPYSCAIFGAAVSAVLFLATAAIGNVFEFPAIGIGGLMGYFLLIGALGAWAYALQQRGLSSAA